MFDMIFRLIAVPGVWILRLVSIFGLGFLYERFLAAGRSDKDIRDQSENDPEGRHNIL